jgi:Protein of unknown function (DUF2971)
MTEKLSDISPYLYHYTNEQGLKGILENQCLWATHYKFLNDFSETALFKEALTEYMYFHILADYKQNLPEEPNIKEKIARHGGLETIAKKESMQFAEVNYEILVDEVYITSFSKHWSDNEYVNNNGILSQWRAYGGDGGYVIVLNSEALDERIACENQTLLYGEVRLTDVIYSHYDEHKLLLLLQDIANYDQEQRENIRSNRGELEPGSKLRGRAYRSMAEGITCYKHRGFIEEHEARIVTMFPPLPNDEKKLFKLDKSERVEKERKFRSKNGTQVPYIELFRPYDKFLPIRKLQPLPIEKIIVGPHKDKELRAANLRVILRNTGIKVTISDIPYIN